MKKTIILFAFILYSNTFFSQTHTVFLDQTNEFLKASVSTDGKIDYAKLKKGPGGLLYILKNAENLKIDALDKDTRVAFWINAYNLLVIKNIIENYPLRSVNFVSGFFDKKFKIASNEVSLNEIQKIIGDLIKDPGIHFILSNGTNGGPKLMSAAYFPETVMYQISLQVKSAINKVGFVKIDKETKTVELPKVFELHKTDFITQYFNEIDFINVFLDKKIDNKLKILYSSFDITLNDLK